MHPSHPSMCRGVPFAQQQRQPCAAAGRATLVAQRADQELVTENNGELLLGTVKCLVKDGGYQPAYGLSGDYVGMLSDNWRDFE